jgi:AraC-like DNA-binding protein
MRNGCECSSSSIAGFSDVQSYYLRSPGPPSYGTISLPIDEMASLSGAVGGRDQISPKDYLILNPSPSALARLRRLHEAAGHLAEDAPEILANPDAAQGLEQTLVEAIVDCLCHGQRHETTLAQGQHAIVMRRFRRAVEASPEQPLFIPEICKAIGVSERTLRMCCQEHLGMAPKRYLLLRRMHLARRALRQADPNATSVTAIGTRYGFWELGRFAVEYQALFGESPSVTLHRPSE